MGSNYCNKLLLLMWKNYLVFLRKPLRAVFEFLIPILLFLTLILVRWRLVGKFKTELRFNPFSPDNPLPSIFKDSLEIACSPKSEPADKIENYIKETSNKASMKFTHFKDSKDLDAAIKSNPNFELAIQFDDALTKIGKDGNLPTNLNVTIRMKSENKDNTIRPWYTHLKYPVDDDDDDDDSGNSRIKNHLGGTPDYQERGFLFVQQLIVFGLINIYNNLTEDSKIMINKFPYPVRGSNEFYNEARWFLILAFLLVYLYHLYSTIDVIMNEKEHQLKESMKVMGLPGWLYWLSWFLRSYFILLVVTILHVILMCLKITHKPVLVHSNATLFFVFLQLFVCSFITYLFLITTLFKTTMLAHIVGPIFYIMSYAFLSIVTSDERKPSLGTILGMSLIQGSAFCFGIQLIIELEALDDGIQWENMWEPVLPESNLTFGYILIMLLLDTILYMLIALYIEAIHPGSFGIPEPWYFLVSPTYWCPSKVELSDEESNLKNQGDNFEEFKENLPKGIQLTNLSKTFGTHEVVKNVNLDMYEGHITVLLGHNGAGKTTTMSMITGMFPPTKGTAIIEGYDVRTNVKGVRDSMAICFQHDVLFDTLTVNEHIALFAKLKGLSNAEIMREKKRYLEILELERKADTYSRNLSGGMKRKLCVILALCGKSKIVVLDEPTAGMDPSARRTVWALLQQEKQGRTILLTTHFMDEADLLGDRIAILKEGELQCCGTSFFLKKKYSSGYYIIMEVTPKCVPNNVTALLKQYVPKLQIYSYVGTELMYQIPEGDSSKFESMLYDLEQNLNRLGVLSYGVSPTTLEEVFLKVGAEKTLKNTAGRNVAVNSEETNNQEQYSSGCALITNQIIAMILKRFYSTLRTWYLFLFQVIFPVVYLLLDLLLKDVSKDLAIPLEMTLNSYRNTVTLMSGNASNPLYSHYKNIIPGEVKQVSDITTEILALRETNPNLVRNKYIVGVTFNERETVAWFNGEPYHSSPLALGLVLNAFYRQSLGSEKSVIFINHPMPLGLQTKLESHNEHELLGFSIVLPLCFVMGTFILFHIKERTSSCKHLQFVSGINTLVFWITTFLYDLILYFIIVAPILITVTALRIENFKTTAEIGRLALVFTYFGFFVLSFIYVCSYMTSRPTRGYIIVTIFGFITGVFFMIITIAVKEVKKMIAEKMFFIFSFSPFYAFSISVVNLAAKRVTRLGCTEYMTPRAACLSSLSLKMCCDMSYYSLKEPGIGLNIIISFAMFAALFLGIIIWDYGSTFISCSYGKRPIIPSNLDSDVKEENEKIKNTPVNDLCKQYRVVVCNLTKYYNCKKNPAVNGICLGVKPFECFGLLGVNGAGKTTTFKMMTGDVTMSYGNVWVDGSSVKNQLQDVYKQIGYCPQFDGLLDDLTVKETLLIFALIRGIPTEDCFNMIKEFGHELELDKHIKKKVKELSGGNKRKLSTALALIGDPPVVYLDEPTTGMDPATKRHIWNLLARLRNEGKCLILTSHSMEECEALCSRAAIMVNGSFKCLGSVQRLKSKFAQGCSLTIKVKKRKGVAVEQDANTIDGFIQKQFPKADLKQRFQELLVYQIRDNPPWSQVFGILEKNKAKLNIEDYSVAQCSLEDVFLSFTEHQK